MVPSITNIATEIAEHICNCILFSLFLPLKAKRSSDIGPSETVGINFVLNREKQASNVVWTKRDLKRSYPCNTELLKYLRERRNWSQKQLAQIAGYSERLISKVESGGNVAVATIEILAKALSTTSLPVYPEDLISDPVAMTKTFVQAFHELKRDMVSKIRHFVDEHAVFHFSGDPSSVPFAGTHQGIDEFAGAINRFFEVFEIVGDAEGLERVDRLKDFRYFAKGNDVVVWGEAWIQPIGQTTERPVPVTQRMRFRKGKLYSFEDRFDGSFTKDFFDKDVSSNCN